MLTNGLRPPSPAYHRDDEWLRGWAGGLLTTCGPEYMGGPRIENGVKTSLHGRYSNSPAVVEKLLNPDPHRAVRETERGLQPVGFDAEGGIEREGPGAVLVRAGRLLDEGFDGFNRDPRRDFAGDMPAHAVGNHEQADVRPRQVAVFVAGAAQTRIRADGPRERRLRAHDARLSPVRRHASA